MSRVFILIAYCAVVESAYENILCNWLRNRSLKYASSCFFQKPFCEWEEVTCTTNEEIVHYQLNMTNMNIGGSLAEDLRNIETLTHLYLSGNQFTDSLPNEWNSLSNLKVLDLSNNHLSGKLHASWKTMLAMTEMKLSNNNLNQNLPEEWSSLTNLQILNLDHNQLTGSLPSSWSSLTNLVRLDVSYNQLSSWIPSSWTSLYAADELIFDENPYLNCVPPSSWTSNMYSCSNTETVTEFEEMEELVDRGLGGIGDFDYEDFTGSSISMELSEEMDFETFSEPRDEPKKLPVIAHGHVSTTASEFDESLIHMGVFVRFCSITSITCKETETGFREELLLNDPYYLSPEFSGKTAFGLKSLDTSAPTSPDFPHKIFILSGSNPCNDTSDRILEIAVLCPFNRFYCERNGKRFCSLSQNCIDLDASFQSLDKIRSQLSDSRLHIQLKGPEIVQIQVGQSYTSCNICQEVISGTLCDDGAEAWDEVEESLTFRIEACVTNNGAFRFWDVGLEKCTFNTSLPGSYNISFFVQDSTGYRASVQRKLEVLPICPLGEIICKSVQKCSIGGSCFLHTGKPTETRESNLDSLFPTTIYKENTIELVTTDFVGHVVSLEPNQSYKKCEANQIPKEKQKCEPGAIVHVSDPSIEYEIYACPSSICKYGGRELCTLSLFEIHGLSACYLNTSLPGSQFEILFMAVPSNSSFPRLFTSRSLNIEFSCGHQYQCDGTCSPVPCDEYFYIFQDEPPTLYSTLGNSLTLEYGVLSSISILPCLSSNCAVSADDPEDGDLTENIEVVEITSCKGERTRCSFCAPEDVPSGNCLPGIYRYRYSIEDSAGNAADPIVLEVYIVEVAEWVITFVDSGYQMACQPSFDQPTTSQSSELIELLSEIASFVVRDTTQTSLNVDHFIIEWIDEVVQISITFIGISANVISIPKDDHEILTEKTFLAKRVLETEHDEKILNQRKLQQDSEDLNFENAIQDLSNRVNLVDISHLTWVLENSEATLETEQVDETLGAILSVLGELNQLYHASILRLSTFVESISAAFPDYMEEEKALMGRIETVFKEMESFQKTVESRLNDTESFDLLTRLENVLDATLSAEKETIALLNAQLNTMDHMQNYQGFVEEIQRLSETHTCIETSSETLYGFMMGEAIAQKEEADSPLRGVTNDRNFIVGGVLIQTERSIRHQSRHGRFAHLYNTEESLPSNLSQIPYGRDPVFLVHSMLYDIYNALRMEQYYDTQSSKTSPSGLPYGFEPSEIPSKLGTHFVYIDIQFDRMTAAKLMEYLKEGQFLDEATDSITLRFVTYNPQFPSTIMTVNEMKCVWNQEIDCNFKVDALPDTYSKTRWLSLLAVSILTLLYGVYFTGHIFHHCYSNRLKMHPTILLLERGWKGFVKRHWEDALTAMFLSLALFSSILLLRYEISDLGSDLRFEIYDSCHFEGANWLLHKRVDIEEIGNEERWKLPDDANDIHRMADFFESISKYRYLASIQSITQTFAIMALILRLFSMAFTLPRVSIIAQTFYRSALPLLYFMVPFVIMIVGFAVMGTLCFGYRVESLSSFSVSIQTLMDFTFFGEELIRELLPKGILLDSMERVVAISFGITIAVFLTLAFINFTLAIFTDAFLKSKSDYVKQQAEKDPLLYRLGATIRSEFQSLNVRPKISEQNVDNESWMIWTSSQSSQVKEHHSRAIFTNETFRSENDEELTSIPSNTLEIGTTDEPGNLFPFQLITMQKRKDALLDAYEDIRLWIMQAQCSLIRDHVLPSSFCAHPNSKVFD